MTVAIRIVDSRTAFVLVGVADQPLGRIHDFSDVRADQSAGPGFYRLGPLRLLAHNQHGLAEGGCFFLNASRIGEQQIRPAHHVHKRNVVERINQMDVRPTA